MTIKHFDNQAVTVYLDLDGVIADWQAGAEKIIGYKPADTSERYPAEDWQKILDHQRIYRDLPVIAGATGIINIGRQLRDEFGWNLAFLTAVPKDNDMPWAFMDKVMWTQRWGDIPVFFGPYSTDKAQHCQAGDILVDDRPDNCSAWTAAGGRAVLVEPSGNVSGAQVALLEILDQEREARAAERSNAQP